MLVLKSDLEPAIKEVQEEIAQKRREDGAVGTARENSRVGDSSTNGRTERAIQVVGGMIRTLKFALEERTGGEKIALGHPVGVTGNRLILTALKELHRRREKHALVSLCVGGGQGGAIILERAS